MNSTKHGLMGSQILIPGEDASEWCRFLEAYIDLLQPVGVLEKDMVNSIAADSWRLRRVPGVESSALSRAMNDRQGGADGDEEQHNTDGLGIAFIQLDEHGFLTKKLPRYAGRLVRQRKQNIALLDELQRRRRQHENQAIPMMTFAPVPSSDESDDEEKVQNEPKVFPS